jgi:heat shock protein HspQ
MNVDPEFSNRLVVFDGDMPNEARITRNKPNYMLLPVNDGNKHSPEMVLREFIHSSKADSYFLEQGKRNPRVKREYFREHDLQNDSKKTTREIYKIWFNKHREVFEKSELFDYWRKANQALCDAFRDDFIVKHNRIARKLNFPLIG